MRLVRKEGEAAAPPAGAEPKATEAKAAPAETADSKAADAPAQAAAPKAKAGSGGKVPGATPRYNRPPDEKAALIARARAHAADVRARKAKG
jgi:hypothetical protein